MDSESNPSQPISGETPPAPKTVLNVSYEDSSATALTHFSSPHMKGLKCESPDSLILPSTLCKHEKEKLDTWLDGIKFGEVIEGTSIIPCKTFLDHPKW
jgi:atypical dual specificity phosphatase